MNDNRNMMLAIVLSAFVLLGWTLLAPKYFPTATPQTTVVKDGKSVPTPQPAASPGGAPATTAPQQALAVRSDIIASTPRVKIDTPNLFGSINLKGARIDDLRLVRQREGISARSAPVRLFSPVGAPHA